MRPADLSVLLRAVDGADSERALTIRDRIALRRAEPADLFAAVTLIGTFFSVAAGSVDGTLFFTATFGALLAVGRLQLPTGFELAVTAGIVLQGWGNALLLFEYVGWYDKAVHFLTPLLMIPALYLLLARVGAVAPLGPNQLRRGALGVFIITLALGVALAATWELVEGSADRWLGMSLAHGYLETIDDLYCSLMGSVGAAAMLAWLASAPGRTPLSE